LSNASLGAFGEPYKRWVGKSLLWSGYDPATIKLQNLPANGHVPSEIHPEFIANSLNIMGNQGLGSFEHRGRGGAL
jgi:hypothetical protein